MTNFLLRFQQPCFVAETEGSDCGTQTATNVNAEGSDLDPSPAAKRDRLLPAVLGATKTAVAREQSDECWGMGRRSGRAIRAAHTKTITAVGGEAVTHDPTKNGHSVFPKINLATLTEVKREQADTSSIAREGRLFPARITSRPARV